MSKSRRLLRFFIRDRESGWGFAIGGTLVYASYLVWGHAYHELWRDEIHPWTLARVADGFWDLVTGDRVYDGHPPLWYWYLRVFSWLTARAWGLHLAAILVMGSAALLFLRFAPFPRLLKLLLLASYMLGYEYGVLSRNYSLSWLMLVLFCCAYHPLKPRFVWLSILLALLALTSVFGALMACSLFLVLVPLGITAGAPDSSPALFSFGVRPRLLIGAALLALGLAFLVFSTAPPDPNPFAPGWNFNALNPDGAKIALKRIVYALLPVRGFHDPGYWVDGGHFWNRDERLLIGVAIGLAVSIPLALVPRWSEVAAFLLGLALLSVFQLVRYGGGMRHIGNLFIFLVAVCWIARLRVPKGNPILSTVLLTVIGLFQLESFWAAAAQERIQSFSGGQEMATWIEKARLQDMPIVAGQDGVVITVTGYLNRPFISAQTEEINQTMAFHGRRRAFSEAALVKRAAAEVLAKHHAVLVLSDHPLPSPKPPGLKFSLLFQTTQGGLGEWFWLYRMEE